MAKRIEFDLPDGFSLPDGISTNGEFDALATIKLKDDGSACLVAIDGHRMPGYTDESDEDESSEKPDNKSYSEASSEGMPGGMMEGY
jgi:hypothetical protein